MKAPSLILRSLFSLFIFSILILSGCSKDSSQDPNEDANVSATNLNDDFELTFLTSPWPPDALNYLAQEKGFFEANDVNVELLWADGYEETFDFVESGDLDVWNTTLLDAVAYQAENNLGQAIFVQDYSAGADAVVSMSNFDSIADLKDKKVGVEQGTVGEFFLEILLEREGLSLADLEVVDTSSEAVLAALESGDIDAGVCYEPCPTDVLSLEGNVIVDSAKERNLIVDVYVAKESHFLQYKDEYVKALSAITDAGEYFNEFPEESAEIMSEVLDMSPEEIIATFEGLRIPDFRENQTAFNRSSGFSSLYNLANLASQYLEEQGLIDSSFEVDRLINSTLIDSINR